MLDDRLSGLNVALSGTDIDDRACASSMREEVHQVVVVGLRHPLLRQFRMQFCASNIPFQCVAHRQVEHLETAALKMDLISSAAHLAQHFKEDRIEELGILIEQAVVPWFDYGEAAQTFPA